MSQPVVDKLERPQSKLFLLLAVTLLAAFFRLYRLGHLPPGDGYDPALYGVDALQILRGARPIFLTTNIGREVLFSYTVAVCFLAFGVSTQTIHLASALVGILTVPMVYLVAEELFADERGFLKQFGGIVAALMVALSYWHLNWSRYGVRAILVPFFAALTFYFLWRGLRKKSLWAFVMCGASLGLSMYTYQAARLLPVLIVIGFVCKQSGVIRDRKIVSRQDWRNFLVVAGVASLVFAPLGYYFLTHPGSFSQRIEQAFVVEQAQDATDKLHSLLDHSVKALLAFNFIGDRGPYSTIPRRPSLNPFLSLLFFLGIGVSLTRARRPSYLFLLAWLGVMLIPATVAGKAPTAKRAIGTLPAVAALIAIGALAPWQILRRWSASWSKKLGAVWGVLLVGGFIYSSIVTYQDYFVTWASNPGMFTHFEVGISAIGEYVRELPPDERVYISPELPAHPGIRFHSGLREDVKGYNGRVCLVTPEQLATATTYIIVPGKDSHSLDLLQRYLPQGEIAGEGPLHYNEPYFLAYRIPAGAKMETTPAYPMAVNLGDQIRLLGYDLDKIAYQAGDAIHLTLYYQGQKPMATHYTVFVHLLGPDNPATDGPLWGQYDSEPCRTFYPTTSWDVGEIIIDRFTLPIPAETPLGDYDLKMGFYNLWTMERLPVLDESGEVRDNIVFLGQVQVIGIR